MVKKDKSSHSVSTEASTIEKLPAVTKPSMEVADSSNNAANDSLLKSDGGKLAKSLNQLIAQCDKYLTSNSASFEASAFEQLINSFDEFIELVLLVKRDDLDLFASTFLQYHRTNLTAVQFYELINKILNMCNETAASGDNEPLFAHVLVADEKTNSRRKSASFDLRQQASCVVGRALQILNILITNQNYENEYEDELTTACCNLVAKNFNITSSIARLLLLNHNKLKGQPLAADKMDEDDSNVLLLNDKNQRIAYNVLNKLTANNKVFSVDVYIKQLVNFLINKIAQADFHPFHIQFITNLIRNDTDEIEKIIKSSNRARDFFRQLVLAIKERVNKNSLLNALIIMLKFRYEDFFTVIWPISSSASHVKPSAGKTSSLARTTSPSHHTTGTDQFEPFDLAMSELCDTTSSLSNNPNLDKKQMHSNKYLLISNSINFLYEACKCEPVRKLLERHENYTNLFLIKLNQFLIENKLADMIKLPLSISTKIIRIFNCLATNSDRLSSKLFQIIFNTKTFIESTHSNSASSTGTDISTKLKNLLLSSNTFILNAKSHLTNNSNGTLGKKSGKSVAAINAANVESQKYMAIMNYYLRVCDLTLDQDSNMDVDEDMASNSASLARTSGYVFHTLEFLFNLVKKHESTLISKENNNSTDIDSNLSLLCDKLALNVKYLKLVHSLKGMSKLDEKKSIERIFFYNSALIDVIIRLNKTKEPENLIQNLLECVESNEWLRSPSLIAQNMFDEDLVLSAAGVIMNMKLILRLAFYNREQNKFSLSKAKDLTSSLRQDVMNTLKNEEFLQILAFFIQDTNKEATLKQPAYEVLFDLQHISGNKEFGYSFPLENYVKLGQNMTKTRLNTNEENVNLQEFNSNLRQSMVEKPSYRVASNDQLHQLFEFYELKLSEQKQQEAQLMNMLNQHYSKTLMNEVEFKNLRHQIRQYAQREFELRAELGQFEEKKSEFESKLRDALAHTTQIKEQLADSEKAKTKLKEENQSQTEMIEKLKKDFEQLEKDNKENEECIEQLQKNLANEAAAKKEIQIKVKEVMQRTADLEQQKVTIESKKKEIETQLESCQTELATTTGQLKEKTDDLDKLKGEHDKLKAILSYVKDNYK